MKKTWKKVVSILLVCVLMMALLAGCGSSSSGSDSGSDEAAAEDSDSLGIGITGEDYRIAVNVMTFYVDYFKEVAYGAIMAGEDLGVDVVLFTGEINTPADQVGMIENQIQAGADGIVFTPVDAYGLATAVDECNEAGISTVSETHLIGGNTDCTVSIASDDITTGQIVAERCATELNGSGNVIILNTGAAIVNSQLKCQGISDYFEDNYPDMHILTNMACEGGDQTAGQEVMADLCQTYSKGDFDAVICINDTVALGACISLEENGYTCGDDVKVFAANYSAEISDRVHNGEIDCGIYSWGQLFGYWAVEMCIRSQNGDPVPPDIQQPNSLVTAENADYYDAICERAKNFDFETYMANQK